MYKKKTYYKKRNRKNCLKPQCKKEVYKIVEKQIKAHAEIKQLSISTAAKQLVMLGSANAVFLDCMPIAGGSTALTRVANEITLRSVHIDLRFNNGTWHAAGTPGQQCVTWRVVVFQFKQDDAIVPLAVEMYKTSNANPLGTAQIGPYCTRNQDYSNIYHILYDRMFKTAASTDAGFLGSYTLYESDKVIQIKVPLKYAKKKIQFNTATAPIYGINKIYMFVTNDADPAQFFGDGNKPYFYGNNTVTFTDS